MTNPFLFTVNPSSGVPIYRQLMDQAERQIAAGTLKAGDMMPPVRQVAQELQVNPMTISKAYSLLEAKGFLERHRGQGMAVAAQKKAGLSLQEKRAQLDPAVRQLLSIAQQLRLTRRQLLDYLNSAFEEIDA